MVAVFQAESNSQRDRRKKSKEPRRDRGRGGKRGGERGWVDRREKRTSIMLDLINQLESNYRLSIS